MTRIFAAIVVLLAVVMDSALAGPVRACEAPLSVCFEDVRGSFPLVVGGRPAAVHVDASANPAIQHVARDFAADLARVGGTAAPVLHELSELRGAVVIIGVLGQSAAIDRLVRTGRIETDDIAGEWEAYRQIVVDAPFANVTRALVIVGSDRRGAVFGTYDLSEKIGVSPLHWFADVPTAHHPDVHLTAGERRDQPGVRYRGLFINDEAPALTTWAQRKFGGLNADMYGHVFELILRMKGNTLWPAMWEPAAFHVDDPRNTVLADEMGIVVGTSHHEPMTRAHAEWHLDTDQGVTGGPWDYARNGANLRTFWRGGIERMMSKGDGQAYDSLVTIGMRGDGDEPMAEGTATELLQRIVKDQRRIVAEVTGKPAAETPQVWALYKEVQDYYDHGMTVPDDVIVLFCDDNWGQIRRLPAVGQRRGAGYGVYYHFDYVGGPRNYKWLNTVQAGKTWQQMDLAYAHGVDSLWIVNVGDIKPLEYPLQFFLKMAWDPRAMTLAALRDYPLQWARATFGAGQARQIADLVTEYGRLAARRKPELLDAGSYALGAGSARELDGGEFGAIVAEWRALSQAMRQVKASLAASQRDAYFQLVEHPILALANLHELYYAVAWNRRLAAADDDRANAFADQAETAFTQDQAIADAYHRLNGGKWDGMMLQTHIGYTSWQQPERQVMPELRRVATGRTIVPIRFAAPAAADTRIIRIDAPRYSRALEGKGMQWQVLPHVGSPAGAMLALPQGRAATTVADQVGLEYDLDLAQGGDATVEVRLVPTLDTQDHGGNRWGLSIDDGPVRTLVDRQSPTPGGARSADQQNWVAAVSDNARVVRIRFPQLAAGAHVLKFWRLDDNVVLAGISVELH